MKRRWSFSLKSSNWQAVWLVLLLTVFIVGPCALCFWLISPSMPPDMTATAPLPPTFTPPPNGEVKIEPGLVLQNADSGQSIRIERIGSHKCAKQFGVLADEEIVVYYTTNSFVFSAQTQTEYVCVEKGKSGTYSWPGGISVRAVVREDGSTDLYLPYDGGWKVVSP